MASEFNADDILEVSTSGYKSCPTSGPMIVLTSGPVLVQLLVQGSVPLPVLLSVPFPVSLPFFSSNSAFGSVIPIGSKSPVKLTNGRINH